MPVNLKVNFEKQVVFDDTNIGRQYVFSCDESVVKLSEILSKLEEFKGTLSEDHNLALSDFFHLCTKGKNFSNEKQVKTAFLNGFLLGKFASNTNVSMIGTEVRLVHNVKRANPFEDEDDRGEEDACI